MTLDPQDRDPIGFFADSVLYYYYEDYPDKFLEVPIYVTIEGCDDDQATQFSSDSIVEEVYLAQSENQEFKAPILESRVSCAGDIAASYYFVPLSVPEGTTMSDFLEYEASNHTFIAKPLFDLSMLNKAISGNLIGTPDDSEELFISQISVQYVTNGPEFEELTDGERKAIKPITCSQADADWSFNLPQVVASE